MRKKLIVLVADKDAQFTGTALLARYHAFGIHHLTQQDFDVYTHPQHDPGVCRQAAAFLRPFITQYDHAPVFLDLEGSGQEHKSAEELAREIEADLARNGWQDRAAAIVFDPELEIWAWVDSPHLPRHSGWPDVHAIQDFLQQKGFWLRNQPKPQRPKEALAALLREKKIQCSSSIFKNIAAHAGFQKCNDPAFLKFKQVLQAWFG